MHKFDQAAKEPRLRCFGNAQVAPLNHPPCSPHIHILPEGSPNTSPLAAPSSRCTLPRAPSDRVIPTLSPVHWYMQHPSHSAPLPLHKTEHVSITARTSSARPYRRSAWASAGQLRMLTALDGITPVPWSPCSSAAFPTRRTLIPHAPSPGRSPTALTITPGRHRQRLTLTLAYTALDVSARTPTDRRDMEAGNQDIEAYGSRALPTLEMRDIQSDVPATSPAGPETARAATAKPPIAAPSCLYAAFSIYRRWRQC
ncbi:hypothetical protein EDB86DRAFT_3077008 [Lactarius hatsudake]|nr:hypothetical protein EDB86DRAFT_3077008 [Lactarius hatsudake]